MAARSCCRGRLSKPWQARLRPGFDSKTSVSISSMACRPPKRSSRWRLMTSRPPSRNRGRSPLRPLRPRRRRLPARGSYAPVRGHALGGERGGVDRDLLEHRVIEEAVETTADGNWPISRCRGCNRRVRTGELAVDVQGGDGPVVGGDHVIPGVDDEGRRGDEGGIGARREPQLQPATEAVVQQLEIVLRDIDAVAGFGGLLDPELDRDVGDFQAVLAWDTGPCGMAFV